MANQKGKKKKKSPWSGAITENDIILFIYSKVNKKYKVFYYYFYFLARLLIKQVNNKICGNSYLSFLGNIEVMTVAFIYFFSSESMIKV